MDTDSDFSSYFFQSIPNAFPFAAKGTSFEINRSA